MPISNPHQDILSQINQQITTNGKGAITGAIVNDILKKLSTLTGQDKLYEISDLAISSQICMGDTNILAYSLTIKALKDLPYFPTITGLVTVNGKTRSTGIAPDLFIGCDYPIKANQETTVTYTNAVHLVAADYPATVKLYMWDTLSNYADPAQFTVETNPCDSTSLMLQENGDSLLTESGDTLIL